MIREELEQLTKAELTSHAEVVGVKVSPVDSKGTMIDKILGEYAEPKAASVQTAKASDKEKLSPLGALYTIDGKKVSGRKFRVKIFSTEGDSSDVHLIVNGHNIIIQRGKEVVIDEAYVDVLKNAEINTVVQDPDSGERLAQSRLVYPYSAELVA